MKAFVTGANGFIGSNLVKKLVERGYGVKGLVLKGTNSSVIADTGCEILHGDILNPESYSAALKGTDVLFHLAAKVSDWGRKEEFELVNVEGTQRLIEECVRRGVRRFIFISSLAIHKPSNYVDADENTPRNNYSMWYALSKIKGEDLVMEYSQKGKIEGVIIRPGLFPFGPNDMTSFYHIARALQQRIYRCVNKGKAYLSTAYVENLVDGLILSAEREEAKGEVFIIADDVKITWKELTEMIARELGVKPPTMSIPYSIGIVIAKAFEFSYRILKLKSAPPLTTYRIAIAGHSYHFTSKKAKDMLGYVPRVFLKEGIIKTVEWYKGLFQQSSLSFL